MNQLIIIGNLTADPELRTTPQGVNVCTFTVAVNRRSSNKEERQTDFFRVAAWRQLGENCSRFLSKGKKVAVVGEVTARAFEGKDGEIRASLNVTAQEVEFLTPRYMNEGGEERAIQRLTAPQDEPPAEAEGWTEIQDGDLPF